MRDKDSTCKSKNIRPWVKKKYIIYRYMFMEMLPPFGVTLFVFALIFLMTRMLQLTDYVVNFHVGLWPVFLLLLYSLPFFLIFVIPMSTMMAVLLTFLRMSSDNEITALCAAGWSMYRMLVPVALFCTATCLLTATMSFAGLPWGRLAAKNLIMDVAKKSVEIGLNQQTFNDTFKNVVLYVGHVDTAKKTLEHVFIEDRRNDEFTSTITAASGRLLSDPKKELWQVRLNNGMVMQVNQDENQVWSTHFDTYDFRLNLSKALSRKGTDKDEEEMSFNELRRFLSSREKKDDKYYLALLEFHKKFSIPFSCLVLGFAAIPLGIVSRFAKRSFGVILGLGLFLLYYMLLSAGWVFGEAGKYPPSMGMWVPNVAVGIIGAVFFVSTANNRPIFILVWFQALVRRITLRSSKNQT